MKVYQVVMIKNTDWFNDWGTKQANEYGYYRGPIFLTRKEAEEYLSRVLKENNWKSFDPEDNRVVGPADRFLGAKVFEFDVCDSFNGKLERVEKYTYC